MRSRREDRPDCRVGSGHHGSNWSAGLGIGRGQGGQWLSLADAQLALFQRGLEVRSDMADQRNVAGDHHQGEQQDAQAGCCHHVTILKHFLRDAPIAEAFWHTKQSELCHIIAARLAII